jgi:hypothetical protein
MSNSFEEMILFPTILFLIYLSLTLCDGDIRRYLLGKELKRLNYIKFGVIFLAYLCVIVSEILPSFKIYLTQAISWPLFIAYVYSKLSLQSQVNSLRSKFILSEYSYLKSLKAQYEKELEEARDQLQDPMLTNAEKNVATEGMKIAKEKLKNINEIIAGYDILLSSRRENTY